MTPLDFNQPLPAKAFSIFDDSQAMGIAIYFQLADKLAARPGRGPWFQMEFYEAHPTHWIACGRWANHVNESENGWAAWLEPKSVTPDFQAFRRRMLDSTA